MVNTTQNHVGDKPIGEFLLGMKQAKHVAFLKDQGTPRSHRRCRPDQQRLPHQAAFAQKIAMAEKCNDCLFASDGGYGQLDAAVLNVVKVPGRLTLREECLPLVTRNTRTEEDLIDQLFNSTEKRLARTLLLLARYGKPNQALTLPKVSQTVLAEMVGTTRTRVNLFMNKFRELGFIEYNGSLKINNSLLSVVLRD